MPGKSTDVAVEAGSSQQEAGSTASLHNAQAEYGGNGDGVDGRSRTDLTTITNTDPSLSASPEAGEPLDEKRKRLFNIFADIDTKTHPPPPPPKSCGILTGSDLRTHTKPIASPIKPPSSDRARSTMKKLSVRDRRKLRSRLFAASQRMDSKAKAKSNLWTNIQELFEWLEQHNTVRKKSGAKQKELLLPEETVALLAGVTDMSMAENIWYVAVRNGCKVHVLHRRESEGHYRKVILSGSERVLEIVEDRIARARALQETGDPLVDIRKPPIPVFPSLEAMARKNLPLPLVRGVWDSYVSVKYPARLDLLLPISQQLSSVREFAEHVDELTRSLPSHNTNGRRKESHQVHVAKSLLSLFLNDAYHGFLSTAALNRALSYLLGHGFERHACTLFLKAEHFIAVESFNILLKFAAQKQDIYMFRQFLLAMPRLNIRPNAHTWLTFLDCLVSSKAKANLVSRMMQKGYLDDTGAIRTALQVTIQDTFLAHLESGKSVDSFINMLVDTSGANWFPPSLINQMLSVAARLKDFSAMERLLQICVQQGFDVNSSTINQIVLLFRKDIFSALRYLFPFIDRAESKLKKDAWERLFLIAYKGRYYNICRVLWRYACMNNGVTYKMRQSVLTSLIRNVPLMDQDQHSKIWLTSAGKVIVGLDLHHTHYPHTESFRDLVPPEFNRNPVASFTSGYKPSGEERERQQRLASALIRRDIEVGPRYRPLRRLGIMLEAAAVLDQEWNWVPRPTQWLMQNAIQVPLKQSDSLQ
ncbi:hypothetical protein BBP40_012480 [Aspergillus hancockii]|nr:hypothetical protein BBP40_012480 [Aspergillus hancockii]